MTVFVHSRRLTVSISWSVLLAIALSPLPSVGQSTDSPSQQRKTRILWLGSSSTSKELIRCTDEMLNLSGRFDVDSTEGGFVRVDDIAQDGNYEPVGFDAILAEKYDFVVLQVSAGVAINPRVTKQARSVLQRICGVIAESGAVPVLFEHFVPHKPIRGMDVSRKQNVVTDLCVQAAADNATLLAPCGSTWTVAASRNGQDYLRRGPNDFHPNLRGDYLLACCIYAALTGESPVGNRVDHEKYTLSRDDARFFQQIAWDQYKKRTEEKRQAEVDLLFADWDSTHSPGCAIAVIKDGDISVTKGFGMADLENRVPITADTVFNIGAVSTQFTAIAIAKLVNEGRLSLDDDIRKYLPELNDFGSTITVQHLVCQTSGLRDNLTLQSFVMRPAEIRTQKRTLDVIRGQNELNFKPGEEYQDCNANYVLLATIVERVTEQSFHDWMKANVFAPLKMNRSGVYEGHSRVVPGTASAYSRGGEAGFQEIFTTDASYGAGGMYSTANDLARWLVHLQQPPPSDVPVIKQLFQRGVLNDGSSIDFAFGLAADQYRGLRRVGYSGGVGGYASYAGYFPEQNFGVVVLSNENPSPVVGRYHLASEQAMEVAGKYLALESPQQKIKKAVTIDSDVLDAIVGHYLLADGDILTFTREGDSIFVKKLGNGGKRTILPASESEFFYQEFDFWFRFVKNEDGKVRHFIGHSYYYDYDNFAERMATEPFASTTQRDLSTFAGRYVAQELDTAFDLAIEGGKLVAKHQYLDDVVFTAVTEDVVVNPNFGIARFERDVEERITGFRFTDVSRSVRNLLFVRRD